jgi:Spy/CpxP family protein refolding chaperone
MKSNRPVVAASFLVGLLIGMAFGWGAKKYFYRGWHGEGKHERMLDRFAAKLDLTPEQKEKVRALFEEKRRKMNELRDTMHPEFERLRTSTKAEIEKILTPEQLPLFHELEKEWEERRKKRRGHHKFR